MFPNPPKKVRKPQKRTHQKRQSEMNNYATVKKAINELASRVPGLTDKQREKPTQLKTLQLATAYISHLRKVLSEPENVSPNDFRSTANTIMTSRQSYVERAKQETMGDKNS